jgi:hypothetical protein
MRHSIAETGPLCAFVVMVKVVVAEGMLSQ